MVTYIIETNESAYDLGEEVSKHLNDGWTLAGGVSFDGINYIQAIVLNEDY